MNKTWEKNDEHYEMGKKTEREKILKWLKENTKGFKKGFNKFALIFSYYDIKHDLMNYLKLKEKVEND